MQAHKYLKLNRKSLFIATPVILISLIILWVIIAKYKHGVKKSAWYKDRDAILEQVEVLKNDGDLKRAKELMEGGFREHGKMAGGYYIETYTEISQELAKQEREANLEGIYTNLRKLVNYGGTNTAEFKGLVKDLYKINPKNLEFRLYINQMLEEIREQEAIKDQFKNGVHVQLAGYLKSNLKNPNSFEHVKSSYVDTGEAIKVTVVYRGRNGFNAVMTEEFSAIYSYEGDLIGLP